MKKMGFRSYARLLQRSFDFFWGYRIYRRFPSQKVCLQSSTFNAPKNALAIVLQGPILADADFTMETIRFYRRSFPDVILILSTWAITEVQSAELESLDVHCVINQWPENPGISNVNLQIISTKSGLVAAKKAGALHAVKTRTDQRIYNPNFFSYLFSLIKSFPLTRRDRGGQLERLVGISLGSFKYRMYGISDMFMFGHIEDMLCYWSPPLDLRSDTDEERSRAGSTWREFSRWRVCEVYFCTEFLKRTGWEPQFTLSDSWKSLADRFCIIDQHSIYLYWHKYNNRMDRYSLDISHNLEIGFNDWLNVHTCLDEMAIDESLLDQRIGFD